MRIGILFSCLGIFAHGLSTVFWNLVQADLEEVKTQEKAKLHSVEIGISCICESLVSDIDLKT